MTSSPTPTSGCAGDEESSTPAVAEFKEVVRIDPLHPRAPRPGFVLSQKGDFRWGDYLL